MRTRAQMAIACAAAALVVLDIVATASSQHAEFGAATLAMALTTGAIYVVAGSIAARKRPESRIGSLLCIAGLLFLASLLGQSNDALIYTIGLVCFWIPSAVIAHIIVTFPSGRIRAWTEWLVVGTSYLNALVILPAIFLFLDPQGLGCTTCPRNLLLIRADLTLVHRISRFNTWFVIGIAAAMVCVLTYRWWHATAAGRRILGPPLWVGAVLTAEFILVANHVEWLSPTSRFFWVDQALTVAYPLAFLLGLLRTRMSRSAVGDLVIELGRGTMPAGGLRDALAKRLGDPTLELAYAVDEAGGWVDESGHPTELPPSGSGRTATTLEFEGEPVAALIHDEALRHEPELVEAVVSAARLAVTNERLQARVRAQLELVRASRDRVVEAADEERRRLERDLHDGAQQRLVWLSLLLGMADEEVATGDGIEGRRLLEEARAETEGALAELRSLARGIHPAILTNAGLGPAVRSLVNRSQIPVRVDVLTDRRFPPNVEATAYFVVAEALTNAAKHARGSRATVSITAREHHLIIDVSDDGVGGADHAGSGLRGLTDRVAAAGGSIAIDSPPSSGTHLHLELPCA
ncbi:MAG: sensor histidine kinase [Actinomycetota bacterium]